MENQEILVTLKEMAEKSAYVSADLSASFRGGEVPGTPRLQMQQSSSLGLGDPSRRVSTIDSSAIPTLMQQRSREQ